MKKYAPLFVYLVIGILFCTALAYGFRLHDQNECEYWNSIKEDPQFHPTSAMMEQCSYFDISITKGVI